MSAFWFYVEYQHQWYRLVKSHSIPLSSSALLNRHDVFSTFMFFPHTGQPKYARNVASYRNVVLFCFFNNGPGKSCEDFLWICYNNIFLWKTFRSSAKNGDLLCYWLAWPSQSLSWFGVNYHCNEYRRFALSFAMTSSERPFERAPI